MVGGGGVGPKSVRVAGWGATSHGVTGTGTPFLSSDGPSGWRSRGARRVLGVDWALVGSQAALKEGLGVLGCPHHRKPQAKVLGCYAGVSTRRIRRSDAEISWRLFCAYPAQVLPAPAHSCREWVS